MTGLALVNQLLYSLDMAGAQPRPERTDTMSTSLNATAIIAAAECDTATAVEVALDQERLEGTWPEHASVEACLGWLRREGLRDSLDASETEAAIRAWHATACRVWETAVDACAHGAVDAAISAERDLAEREGRAPFCRTIGVPK